MIELPRLMAAPNGARLTKTDHPALPITLTEIVACAEATHEAGADGLHLHVRDAEGRHLLDVGRYREALTELGRSVPEMAVQITTEAAGRYGSDDQRALALTLEPELMSAAPREIAPAGEDRAARRFYAACHEAGIAVQHILYEPDEITRLRALLPDPLFRAPGLQLLFVLGNHAGRAGDAAQLNRFLLAVSRQGISPDWMVCCFGPTETQCLRRAHAAGGKLRVGFENNLIHADGGLAADNAERVAEIAWHTVNHPNPVA